jgi:predicted lipoprotein with Yx(FWY)xxD motif
VRKALGLLVVVALAAGCGDDSGDEPAAPSADTDVTQTDTVTEPEPERTTEPEPTGTEIVLRDSEFGSMLFDAKRQAIYIFENDPKGKSACYDDCAAAWPPVFTDGEPQAGKGVKQSLLGTVERRDGKVQVTYADKPLYFYAHEEPGQVLCHNVHLNGGLWWVVGPDGKRRA